MIRKVTLVVLLGVLAGCGGAEGDADPGATDGTPSPEETTLVVSIVDEGPLDVYFNKDDRECTATNIGDAFDGVTTPRPEVVVRGADGTILGTTKAPRVGGTFADGGCRVDVRLQVAGSDFYEVTVTAGSDGVERSATVDGDDREAKVLF